MSPTVGVAIQFNQEIAWIYGLWIYALKTDSKKSIKKTAKAAGDLTGNKITDKITKYFRVSWKRNRKHTIWCRNTLRKIYISRKKKLLMIYN